MRALCALFDVFAALPERRRRQLLTFMIFTLCARRQTARAIAAARDALPCHAIAAITLMPRCRFDTRVADAYAFRLRILMLSLLLLFCF